MSFDAFDVSLEMVSAVRSVIEVVARRDRALADQMRRAAASVPLNLAEGRRRRGQDRLHSFRIAAGSADELLTGLRVAQAWGIVDPDTIAPSLALLDRELAMLWRLTRV